MTGAPAITEIAPAKVNLFLHVGPVRRDRLHALESLFVFTDDGDRVSAAPARDISLAITGPFARELAPFPIESNLVWRAAHALKAAAGVSEGAALTLDKRLPIASGIGGGSADAAAALRALCALWKLDISEPALHAIAFRLGADVPACLGARPVFVSGAGEKIESGPRLPPLWAVLVNPLVEMPTGPIFRAFDKRYPSPPAPDAARTVAIATYADLRDYLQNTRNDLEPFAAARQSSIAAVSEFIAECPGALLARMSGSGATVFGLFTSAESALRASRRARSKGWWSMSARVASGGSECSGGSRAR